MRIVVANPNTTVAVTDKLLAEGRRHLPAGVELDGATATSGVAAIDNPEAAAAAARGVVDMLGAAGPVAAGIVGGFVDPGLAEARAALTFPVTGIGEASLLNAALIGRRFAVITVGEGTVAAIEAMVEDYRLAARCTRVFCLDGTLLDVLDDPQRYEAPCARAVEAAARGGAGAVVLGGAMFVGMARRIAPGAPVPVIDPMQAAVLQATTLAALACSGSPTTEGRNA